MKKLAVLFFSCVLLAPLLSHSKLKKSDNLHLKKIAREVKVLLKDIDGIKVGIFSNRVIVDGAVLTSQEIARIHNVTKLYGDDVRSLVVVSPEASEILAKKIEKEINKPGVTVRNQNGHYVLEGTVNSERERDIAEIKAKTYIEDHVVDEAVADGKIKERAK